MLGDFYDARLSHSFAVHVGKADGEVFQVTAAQDGSVDISITRDYTIFLQDLETVDKLIGQLMAARDQAAKLVNVTRASEQEAS